MCAKVQAYACMRVCLLFGLQNKEAFNALAEGVVLQLVQFLNKSLRGIIKELTRLPCFHNKLGHREG